MEQITFNSEHLLIGNLGNLFVLLSFASAILTAFFFWKATNNDDSGFWKRAGDYSYWVHAVSVIGIISTLFFIIYNHYFEYDYAWQHSSRALPTHYMISCFWEGQEGSFLLWMFWQAVLGGVLIFNRTKWKAPVLSVIMLSQVLLSTMLLGIEISDAFTFGRSPFVLLREVRPEILSLPVMQMRGIPAADYLKVITDGTGLNPLLQNYWMVIHPPTLFFGFASTIIPFAFAVAGLWRKEYTSWMRPALPWTLMGVAVLGTGIIMGGIWAYESLSFGGYWAWDPVENASLVPWLILVAGLHVMVLNRASGQSLTLTYLLLIASFVLVLYATFLTRSGVLGDTSVHSFTDLGLSRQLLVYLFLFMLVPVFASFKRSRDRWLALGVVVIILVINVIVGRFLFGVNVILLLMGLIALIRNFQKELPLSKKEESVYSREFWMFIGALILILSAVQVISTTSIPVMNKILMQASSFWAWLADATSIELFDSFAKGTLAPPNEPVAHYNKWQLPISIVIALLTGYGQFLRYRKTDDKRKLFSEIASVAIISVVLTALVVWLAGFDQFLHWILLFAAFYSIFGNILYVITGLRGKLNLAGGSVAHIGFALMLIGVLFSGGKKEVISINTLYNYGENFSDEETRHNILLYKNEPVIMQNYEVTYRGDSTKSPDNFYIVDYKHLETGEIFTLYPNAQISREMGLTANPDTRHYLTRDIFTHVSSVPNKLEPREEWLSEKMHEMNIGDSIFVNRHLIILDSVEQVEGTSISADLEGHSMQIATLRVIGADTVYIAKPLYGLKDGLSAYNVYSFAEKASIRLNYFPKEVDGEIVHEIETAIKPKDYIIMKAIVFPYINVLWGGMIVMLVGFALAIRQRMAHNKRS